MRFRLFVHGINWKSSFLFIWGFLISSADLKVLIHPQIHWLITLVFLFPVMVTSLDKLRFSVPILLANLLFLTSIVVPIFFSENPIYDLIQVGKLFMILIVVNNFFYSNGSYSNIIFNSFIFAAVINFFLLMLGKFVSPGFAQIMGGDNRWGTILNYPGSLAKVGILIFVHSLYCLLFIRPISIKYLLLTIISVTIIYFDGSRTVLIVLCIAIVYIIFLLLLHNKNSLFRLKINIVHFKKILLGLLIVGVVIMTVVGYLNRDELGDLVKEPSRLGLTINYLINEGIIAGLKESDPVRFQMFTDALSAIINHPILGGGTGFTVTDTEVGPMNVHNTYLQVWGNYGLLGLLSFLLIVGGWGLVIPLSIKIIQKIPVYKIRARYYNSLFLLFYFAFSGVFHPLSTELSEWVVYIIPLASLNYLLKTQGKE